MFEITKFNIPALLREVADPPKQLTMRGTFPAETSKFLAVVGARRYTSYGRSVCESLIRGLQGHPVVIVSGLALGIDGIAHQAALNAGLHTVAVPGSGLSDKVLYPATHRKLARNILEAGGALVSEFAPEWRPRPESFPQRNRIMAGMSHAVLVVEAAEHSGTLITARLAADYNRDVLAVPGPIHSPTAGGPHYLLKNGAALIHSSEDILIALGLDNAPRQPSFIAQTLVGLERRVFDALREPCSRDELQTQLKLSTQELSTVIASLELKGVIREQLGKLCRL